MALTFKDLTNRKLKELYYNDFTYIEIASTYNCSVGYISKRVNKLIDEKYLIKRPNLNKLVLENDEITNMRRTLKINKYKIIELYNKNIPMKAIAKELNCSYQLITRTICEYKKEIDEEKYPEDIIEYIFELYNKNIPILTIQKIISVTTSVICETISKGIREGIIEKRKCIGPLGSVQLKVIEMYRGHYSITLISDEINKNIKNTDRIIKNLIENGHMKRRNPSNKNNNIITMRNNKDIFINMYKNGIPVQIIADYFEVTQKAVNIFIESILLEQDIEISESIIYNKIIIEKIRVKQLAEELNIPDICIYEYLKRYK